MRLLVCGGRDFNDDGLLQLTIVNWCNQHVKPGVVVTLIHGSARGADRMARDLFRAWGKEKDIIPFPADWKRYGKAAGFIRNQQMLDEGKPDFVIAFPGGNGTADMVARAKKAGVPVLEVA